MIDFSEYTVLLILVTAGLIFYIAAWIQAKYPPKKINHFYGYRTKTSMKSQEIWDFAQQYSAEKLKRCGLFLILIGIASAVFSMNGMVIFWVGLSIVVLAPIYTIIQVEKKLKEKFTRS